MSVANLLIQEASRVSANARYRAEGLQIEKRNLETRLSQIQAQLDAADFALDRLNSYRPIIGDDLQCFRCWMETGRQSVLSPIGGGTTKEDLYRCHTCGLDYSVRI